jgi:hypothetical protein
VKRGCWWCSVNPAVNFGIIAGNSALGGAGDINSGHFDEGRASPITHVLGECDGDFLNK